MVEDHTSLDIGHQNNPSWDQYFLFFWKNIKRIWTLDIRIFVSLLAPEVLLDYQWPNLTIHPIHQSHPIRHIALNEINRPKIDLSRPPMTSNDWLLSANMLARKEDINALFDNIVQSLQLEEWKFSELVSNGAHFSPSLYHMLKTAIEGEQHLVCSSQCVFILHIRSVLLLKLIYFPYQACVVLS